MGNILPTRLAFWHSLFPTVFASCWLFRAHTSCPVLEFRFPHWIAALGSLLFALLCFALLCSALLYSLCFVLLCFAQLFFALLAFLCLICMCCLDVRCSALLLVSHILLNFECMSSSFNVCIPFILLLASTAQIHDLEECGS